MFRTALAGSLPKRPKLPRTAAISGRCLIFCKLSSNKSTRKGPCCRGANHVLTLRAKEALLLCTLNSTSLPSTNSNRAGFVS